MGTVWELDGKSSLHPLQKKIINIPWGAYWCHPIGSPQLFILRFFFKRDKLTRIGTSHVWNFFFFNKWPRLGQGEKIRWSNYKGGQTMSPCAHFICLPSFLPAGFKEQMGRQNPG